MKTLIIGGGGQGLIVADILRRSRERGGAAEPVAILDDDPALRGADLLGLPVLGPVSSLRDIPHDAVIVAIGDNARRRALVTRLLQAAERVIVACHPFSSVAAEASIGAGTMISAGALVLPRVVLGAGVLLNTKSSVDHESRIGDFAHVSAGATIGANVTIGEETLIGLGAVVLSGCRVGARTVVGAGSVVVRDLPDGVVAFGVPARARRPNV
jgi:acetyltransferase EpsM